MTDREIDAFDECGLDVGQIAVEGENLVEGVGERPDVFPGIGDFGFRGVLHFRVRLSKRWLC